MTKTILKNWTPQSDAPLSYKLQHMTRRTNDTILRKKSQIGGQPADQPIYLVYGNDDFLVLRRVQQILDALLPTSDRAFALEEIDGSPDTPGEVAKAVYQAIEAARTPSFLGGRKIVWLKGLAAFGLRQSSEEMSRAMDDLTEFVRSEVPMGHTLIVSARKVDGRSAFAKACAVIGSVEVFDVPEKPSKAAAYQSDAIKTAFTDLGLRATSEVVEEFKQRVGGDTQEIMQEVKKLAVYLGDRKDVSVEDVRAVTCATRESALWDLTDAIGKRDLGEALAAIDRLLFQGEEPVGMLIVVENKLRDLLLYRSCIDRGWLKVWTHGTRVNAEWAHNDETDAAFAKLDRDPRAAHPYAVAQMAKQALGFSTGELQQALRTVLEVHSRFFASNVPPGIMLPFMLIRLFNSLK